MKRYGWLIFLYIIIQGNKCTHKSNEITRLLEIGYFYVTLAEFKEDFIKNNYTKEQLLDSYIEAGICYASSIERGYDKKPSVQKNLNYSNNQLLIQNIISDSLEAISVSGREIRKCYKRFNNKQFLIDYIWKPI